MNIADAVARHNRMQLGCYIDAITPLAEGVEYIHSKWADDNVWNRATVVETQPTGNVVAAVATEAIKFGRAPVLAHQTSASLPSHYRIVATEPELWMRCTPQTFDRNAVESSNVRVTSSAAPAPPPEFCSVFERLFQDEEVNALFRRYYVPALQHATRRESEPYHFVAWEDDSAVGCASLYMLGTTAGLYNVGTLFERQRRGVGRLISSAACQFALSMGAQEIVLQTVVGTHVEAMYASLGFVDTKVITIDTFDAP